jgi:hypothetical protein
MSDLTFSKLHTQGEKKSRQTWNKQGNSTWPDVVRRKTRRKAQGKEELDSKTQQLQ